MKKETTTKPAQNPTGRNTQIKRRSVNKNRKNLRGSLKWLPLLQRKDTKIKETP